jgi:hypothetical protein
MQEAMGQQMQGVVSGLSQSLQGFGSRLPQSGASGAGAGTPAPGTVGAQLKILDDRLQRLETLVLEHHDTLKLLVEERKAKSDAQNKPPKKNEEPKNKEEPEKIPPPKEPEKIPPPKEPE